MAQDKTHAKSLRRRVSNWFNNMSPARAATGFLTIGVLVLIIGLLIREDIIPNVSPTIKVIFDELYSNAGVELLSIGLTVLVIDSLNRRQSEKERIAIDEANRARAEQERKEELILQLGSPDNGFAQEAARLLRHNGWLTDGSLQGVHLPRANLQEMDLRGANLRNASMYKANLKRANLVDTHLQGTYLLGANLEGAELFDHRYGNVEFDEYTILPDWTKWTPDRDMREFTHPEEWAADQATKTQGDGEV